MKLIIEQPNLLKILQSVSGAVERRQTFPILANVKLETRENYLVVTATDLEIELQASNPIKQLLESGAVAVDARKLIDICRTLPPETDVEMHMAKNRFVVTSGKSRFVLLTQTVDKFPTVEANLNATEHVEYTIPQNVLKKLIEKTYFCTGEEDVRYYLNGLFFSINQGIMKFLGADGHRLGFANYSGVESTEDCQIIIPRKAVIELMRLLEDIEDTLKVSISANHIRVQGGANGETFTFVSKLIDAQFPNYEKNIPKARSGDKIVLADRNTLKQALIRVAILSNEKFRVARMYLSAGTLKFYSNNPEQEEAEEELSVNYEGPDLEIGFNINYLIDACNALESEEIKMIFSAANRGVVMEELEESNYIYVVMPMHL